MGTRSLWGIVLLVALAGSAGADPKSDLAAKSKEAMDAYDNMDYDASKAKLSAAIKAASTTLAKDPALAKAYVALGVASLAGGDNDGAKAAFVSAVKIDAKVQIPAEYKSPELSKLLEAARAEAGKGGGTPVVEPGNAGDADCASAKGVQHNIVDSGKGGVALPLEAVIGSDVKAEKVSIQFRSKETPEFTEVKMTKEGACKYVGQIPASAMKGSLLFYYVAAYDKDNRVIASKGSSGAPNTMDIDSSGGGSGAKDGEIPGGLGAKKGGGASGASGGSVRGGGTITGGKPAKVFLAVVGGTGFGYVTGNTEGGNEVKNCCVGNSLLVVTPELGFNVNNQLAIGLAGRFGVPVGANVAGHATLAPGAMLRVRYALSSTGEGVRVMGQIGGGIMRNTIKLDEAAGGMDTDIVAQGPLLLGAGIGFTKKLGGNLSFVADFSALAGIAVVSKLGTSTLNSGVGGDVSLGLAVGF